jgi:hypothetical protein
MNCTTQNQEYRNARDSSEKSNYIQKEVTSTIIRFRIFKISNGTICETWLFNFSCLKTNYTEVMKLLLYCEHYRNILFEYRRLMVCCPTLPISNLGCLNNLPPSPPLIATIYLQKSDSTLGHYHLLMF